MAFGTVESKISYDLFGKMIFRSQRGKRKCDQNTSQYSTPSNRNLQGNWSTSFSVYRGRTHTQTDKQTIISGMKCKVSTMRQAEIIPILFILSFVLLDGLFNSRQIKDRSYFIIEAKMNIFCLLNINGSYSLYLWTICDMIFWLTCSQFDHLTIQLQNLSDL